MAKIFPAPAPGSRNVFVAFRDFIDEMEAQSCTGLEIKIGSKRYAFSITHEDEGIRIPIGFKQFPDPRWRWRATTKNDLLTPNINYQDGKLHRN